MWQKIIRIVGTFLVQLENEESCMQNVKRRVALNEFLDEGWQERTSAERRSDDDKRISYNCEYFIKGGEERRQLEERRQTDERRDGWMRVGKWRSESVFDE